MFSVYHFAVRLEVFQVEHLWLRWPEDVGIEQSYLVSHFCQRYGQVGGNGGFAYAALARRYGHDVLNVRQYRFRLGLRFVGLAGVYRNFYVLAYVGLY